MENIKDYILRQDAEDINATIPAPPRRPKTKVSYETVFASGPDFAVRRKTPKTSMVMVVIVSKAQFYIKDVCMYLNYDPAADFLPQFESNTEEILNAVRTTAEKLGDVS